jgi:hypothetical protein
MFELANELEKIKEENKKTVDESFRLKDKIKVRILSKNNL